MFADDRKVLPLQAADMWAWSCRKLWLMNDNMIPSDSYPIEWGKVGDIPQMILQWTEVEIEQELSRVADALKVYEAVKGVGDTGPLIVAMPRPG